MLPQLNMTLTRIQMHYAGNYKEKRQTLHTFLQECDGLCKQGTPAKRDHS